MFDNMMSIFLASLSFTMSRERERANYFVSFKLCANNNPVVVTTLWSVTDNMSHACFSLIVKFSREIVEIKQTLTSG